MICGFRYNYAGNRLQSAPMKKAIGFLLIAFCVVALGVILRPNQASQPQDSITVYSYRNNACSVHQWQ